MNYCAIGSGLRFILVSGLFGILFACGGGGTGSDGGDGTETDSSYRLGGSVTGLKGSGLLLRNGTETLSIGADGPFSFSTRVPDRSSYEVAVASQPDNPQQLCVVENGTGVLAGADVNDILVRCEDVTPDPAPLPPDPASLAPPLDATGAADLRAATAFLYSGPDAVQTGVDPGDILPGQAAVLRGVVRDARGDPLPGVTVRIKDRPAFGSTLTRLDGAFDLAVNAGGRLLVEFRRDGHLTVHREARPRRQGYLRLPDVVMRALDERVSTIDLAGGQGLQTARGSAVADGRGERQATLLFPAGTTAAMVLPDGSRQALDSLDVRLTEYTVGEDGPRAMPASLPATSGYTYAVELSVDQAIAQGAERVEFSRPLYLHVENFLDFPVGGIAPVGWYDRAEGRWKASDNGRVIEILSVSGGLAEIDVDGSGRPADAAALAALDLDDAERARLAELYAPGTSLWRVPVTHFTPWDINWPFGIPQAARDYMKQALDRARMKLDPCATPVDGSIIECENQVLGQHLALAGMPFGIAYRSGRVAGRQAAYRLEIPVTGSEVPAELDHIRLEVHVAGRVFSRRLEATPDQVHEFTWDGLDAYGRRVPGMQRARIRIGNVFRGEYMQPADRERSFAEIAGTPFDVPPRRPGGRAALITLWRDYDTPIGTWDARQAGLGGWTLDIHHHLDKTAGVLFFGDGRRRAEADRNDDVLRRLYPDNAFDPDDIVRRPGRMDRLPDGRVLVADRTSNRVYAIDAEGVITVLAGNGEAVSQASPDNGDGGPALQARVSAPRDVAAADDGGFYVLEQGSGDIRHVSPAGTITTYATVDQAIAIDVDPEGRLHVLTGGIGDGVVYRFDEAGNRTLYAGGVNRILDLMDDVPATESGFYYPSDIAFDPAGNLYIADTGSHNRIRRVGTDGIITSIAGTDDPPYDSGNGDGGPATSALVLKPRLLWISDAGEIYIYQESNTPRTRRIRKIDVNGIITTVAGDDTSLTGEEGLAVATSIRLVAGMAMNGAGELLLATRQNSGATEDRNKFWQVVDPLEVGIDEAMIAAADGTRLYHFGADGRHLRTLDALTRAELWRFDYDAEGRLSAVVDAHGNTVSIERDADGRPQAIVSADGLRTSLALDANGYLAALTNPAGESRRFDYTADGLMTRFVHPDGSAKTYAYDDRGRLTGAVNTLGGEQTLAAAGTPRELDVTRTSAMYRVTRYRVAFAADGSRTATRLDADGSETRTVRSASGVDTETAPDGSSVTTRHAADPLFPGQALYASAVTVTRGARSLTVEQVRSASLADPARPDSLTELRETQTLNGRSATRVYTASDRRTVATSPEGRTLSAVTTATGQPERLVRPGVEDTLFGYDPRGRLQDITQGTRSTTLTYGADGFLASITDALGQTVSYRRDAAGRVIRQERPDGEAVGFAYDANGWLAAITPPGRDAHAFTFDAGGRLTRYSPPTLQSGGGDTIYGYDVEGRVTEIRHPGGDTLQVSYDEAGRLQSITGPGEAVAYTYAASGLLQRVGDREGGALDFRHEAGLLTAVVRGGVAAGSVEYAYDEEFRVSALTVNGSDPVSYARDGDGLLTGAGDLSLSRDAASGALLGTTLGDVSELYGYNAYGELASHEASFQTTRLYAVSLGYDDLGRITSRRETVAGITTEWGYVYDAAGRLQSVSRDGVTRASYAYDANGNRLSREAGSTRSEAGYDAQDRLVTHGDATFSYSDNGTLLSRSEGGAVTRYDYDLAGNLLGVDLPDGRRIDYVVDGLNRRVGKKVDGVLVQAFLYQDALNPIAELDASGKVVSRFVYGSRHNVPDYMIRDGVTYRIIADHLGSPRLVVDVATGDVVQRLSYDEFGVVEEDTNPGFQPFGFAGGLYDRDTGLVRFGARDYAPELGRWTARDPLLFAGSDSNLYAYAFSDPVNNIDIDGLRVGGWSRGRLPCAGKLIGLGLLNTGLSAAMYGVDLGVTLWTLKDAIGGIGLIKLAKGMKAVVKAAGELRDVMRNILVTARKYDKGKISIKDAQLAILDEAEKGLRNQLEGRIDDLRDDLKDFALDQAGALAPRFGYRRARAAGRQFGSAINVLAGRGGCGC